MRRVSGVAILIGVAALAACSSDGSSKSSSTAPLSSVSTTTNVRSSTSGAPTSTTGAPRTPTAADLAAVRVALRPVATGLDSPVDLAFRPDGAGRPGTMYVVEQ